MDAQQQDALAVYASFVGSLIARRRAETSRLRSWGRPGGRAGLMQPDRHSLPAPVETPVGWAWRGARCSGRGRHHPGTYSADDTGNLVDELWHERTEWGRPAP